MDRDFFFVPFYKETDDYFVNDSCRESLRPLIVHIFYLTRDFGLWMWNRIRNLFRI